MAEQLDLTTPTSITTNNYTLRYVGIDVANSRIVVELVSNQGGIISKVYDSTTNPTGASLLSTLNTANLTTTSLIKRIYQRLLTDGVLVGTVSGTPQ